MPTPKYTQIPIKLRQCSWLRSLPGQNVPCLPLNIQPGETVQVLGELHIVIGRPFSPSGQSPQAVATVKLKLVIPDIEKTVPLLTQKEIFIQDPASIVLPEIQRTILLLKQNDISIQNPVSIVHGSLQWLDRVPYERTSYLRWAVSFLRNMDGRVAYSIARLQTTVQLLWSRRRNADQESQTLTRTEQSLKS